MRGGKEGGIAIESRRGAEGRFRGGREGKVGYYWYRRYTIEWGEEMRKLKAKDYESRRMGCRVKR